MGDHSASIIFALCVKKDIKVKDLQNTLEYIRQKKAESLIKDLSVLEISQLNRAYKHCDGLRDSHLLEITNLINANIQHYFSSNSISLSSIDFWGDYSQTYSASLNSNEKYRYKQIYIIELERVASNLGRLIIDDIQHNGNSSFEINHVRIINGIKDIQRISSVFADEEAKIIIVIVKSFDEWTCNLDVLWNMVSFEKVAQRSTVRQLKFFDKKTNYAGNEIEAIDLSSIPLPLFTT